MDSLSFSRSTLVISVWALLFGVVAAFASPLEEAVDTPGLPGGGLSGKQLTPFFSRVESQTARLRGARNLVSWGVDTSIPLKGTTLGVKAGATLEGTMGGSTQFYVEVGDMKLEITAELQFESCDLSEPVLAISGSFAYPSKLSNVMSTISSALGTLCPKIPGIPEISACKNLKNQLNVLKTRKFNFPVAKRTLSLDNIELLKLSQLFPGTVGTALSILGTDAYLKLSDIAIGLRGAQASVILDFHLLDIDKTFFCGSFLSTLGVCGAAKGVINDIGGSSGILLDAPDVSVLNLLNTVKPGLVSSTPLLQSCREQGNRICLTIGNMAGDCSSEESFAFQLKGTRPSNINVKDFRDVLVDKINEALSARKQPLRISAAIFKSFSVEATSTGVEILGSFRSGGGLKAPALNSVLSEEVDQGMELQVSSSTLQAEPASFSGNTDCQVGPGEDPSVCNGNNDDPDDDDTTIIIAIAAGVGVAVVGSIAGVLIWRSRRKGNRSEKKPSSAKKRKPSKKKKVGKQKAVPAPKPTSQPKKNFGVKLKKVKPVKQKKSSTKGAVSTKNPVRVTELVSKFEKKPGTVKDWN